MSNRTTLRLRELSQINVTNIAGCHIGHIEDLIIDLEFQTPSLAILSCTGIVGKSDRLLSVPFRALSIQGTQGPAVLMLPDCALKLDEGFDRENWPAITRDWVASIYSTYGFRPYWNLERFYLPGKKEADIGRSRHKRWPASKPRYPVTHGTHGDRQVSPGQRNAVARLSPRNSRIE